MSGYDLSRLKTVLVDDSPFMLKLLQMILRSMGVRDVRCFQDPGRALSEVRAFQPHLVITDMLMPSIDGSRLTRTLREEISPICFTPILVLSGFTDKEHVMQASDSGANFVLAKPISVETLHRRIIAMIEDTRPFVRTPTYFGPERRLAQRTATVPERRSPTSDADVLYI